MNDPGSRPLPQQLMTRLKPVAKLVFINLAVFAAALAVIEVALRIADSVEIPRPRAPIRASIRSAFPTGRSTLPGVRPEIIYTINRGIYTAVQKLVQTFLGQSNAQRQVVMIEYPRIGMFTVGFAMGRAWSHLEEKKNAQLVNVFVPTTPNPTSGFFLLVPINEVTLLNMTMEEALKLITSSGLITPDDKLKINGR